MLTDTAPPELPEAYKLSLRNREKALVVYAEVSTLTQVFEFVAILLPIMTTPGRQGYTLDVIDDTGEVFLKLSR